VAENEVSMNRALLVIDVQNEYFSGMLPITHPKGSLPNILKAMDEARLRGISVVVIQHASDEPGAERFIKGSPGWELHPEIAQRDCDVLIHKNLPGSFTGTALDEWLRARDISTLTICGYMTQMCCDTTARQAAHRGYKVEFLSDATGTLDFENQAGRVSAEELHRAVLVTQALGFSQVMSTAGWIKALGPYPILA
jgi:nicotinamidase-related amidase